ncbi:hypothetical protein KVP02_09235 [Halobacterium salinarum]|uniref:hypothetical protein n=1 Tax=Halobacterium salinarum TaxID=2242 RepID=UPI001F2116F5|nr:hypothetical protein [Halobacterium salinarum]MCF2207831.1 hypothetical protein [Halobacterium salinarum]
MSPPSPSRSLSAVSECADARRIGLIAVVIVVSAFSLGAAPPAAAAPPPADVCGACGPSFEEAAAAAGGDNTTVAASTMDVHVAANGTTQVSVDLTVGSADARWAAANADAVLAALAAGSDPTATDGIAPVPAAATLTAGGDTVTIEYDAPGVAHTAAGGVVVVDAVADGRPTGWEVDADAVRLHAPADHVVTHGPADAPVTTWTRGDQLDDAVIAYATSDGLVATAATQAALVAETGPAFLRYAAIVLAPTLAVLAGLLWSTRAVGTRVPTAGSTQAGTVVAAAGGAAAVALVGSGVVSTYFELSIAAALFAALTAAAVGTLAASGRLRTVRGLTAAAVGTPIALGTLAAVGGALTHPAVALPTVRRAVVSGVLVAQLGVFVVLGAAHEVAPASRWQRLAAVLAPPAAVVAVVGPTLVLVAWLPLLVVLAHPTYWFGRTAAGGLRSV